MIKKRSISLLLYWAVVIMPLCSQTNHLKKEITVSLGEMELRQALPKIGEAGSFYFSYNADIIPGDQLVTVDVAGEPVEKVLDDLLGPDLRYQVIGNHLVILPGNVKKNTKVDSRSVYTIKGTIYDALSGQVIAEASVYELNGKYLAATEANGAFSLTLPQDLEQPALNFSKLGYLDTLILVRPADAPDLRIRLNPLPKPAPGESIAGRHGTPFNERKMIKAIVPAKAITAAENIPLLEERFLQVSLLPFIGSNRFVTGLITNRLSVNLLAGYAEGVRGLELGGFLNIDRRDVRGVQLGGFGNMVGRNTRGVQMAGFFNINGGSLTGWQVAGFSNLVMDTIRGVQLAGFSNALRGTMYGTQLSGFANFTTQHVDGLQASGFANIAAKDVKVAQLSGFANYCRNVNGLQAAGFANMASGKNHGAQVAGFVNMAGEVRGLQLAPFNFSDTVSKGAPLGLFSFVLKGYHPLEVSTNELFPLNLTLKTGVSGLYNVFTAGLSKEMYHAGYGFGSKIRMSPRWSWSNDLTAHLMASRTEAFSFMGAMARFAPAIDFKIIKHLTLTAGPTLLTLLTPIPPIPPITSITPIPSIPLLTQSYPSFDLAICLGFNVGFRFF